MCLIFSFDFWRDRSFREMTDMIFIDIDTVSVWHTLTMIVHEYMSTEYTGTYVQVQEYMSTEYTGTGVQGT